MVSFISATVLLWAVVSAVLLPFYADPGTSVIMIVENWLAGVVAVAFWIAIGGLIGSLKS